MKIKLCLLSLILLNACISAGNSKETSINSSVDSHDDGVTSCSVSVVPESVVIGDSGQVIQCSIEQSCKNELPSLENLIGEEALRQCGQLLEVQQQQSEEG